MFSFGVCCVFVVSDPNVSVVRNCSYIQNPGFPSSLATSAGLQYTVEKCDNSQYSSLLLYR